MKQLKWLFQFIKPHQIKWGAGFLIDIIGSGIYQICNGIALENIGAGLINSDKCFVFYGLKTIMFGAGVITITGALFWLLYGASISLFRENLKINTFKKILNKKHDIVKDSPAKMLTLLNQDIDMSISIFGDELRPFIYGLGTSLIAIAVIFYTNIWIGIICLSTFAGNIFITLYFKDKQEEAVNKRQKALENLNHQYNALYEGAAVLKSGNIYEKPIQWVTEATKKVSDAKKTERFIALKQNLLIQLFLNLNNVLPMTLGVYLYSTGILEIGKVFFLIQMSIQFIFDYQLMGPALINISKAIAGEKRIYELSNEADEDSEYGVEEVVNNNEIALDFENIKVMYDDKLTLTIDKLQIPKNKLIAVVGDSGAGKSTFLKLILQLIPWTGQLKVFNTAARDYKLEKLRSIFAYIEQTPKILNLSILDNILLGNQEATSEEVKEVVIKAGVDEFAAKLVNGYDTIIGEDGFGLSGGECQRIAIARALLKDSLILLMDEVTSALDNKSESIIQETIERFRYNHTIIIAAHRLKTIKNADYILVFKKGEIIEFGSPEELLQNNGYYYNLINNKTDL